MIADKIGFVVGDLPSVSPITQIGSALFCSRHKQELFEKFNFYETRITEFLDIMKQNMKIEHPSAVEGNLNQNNQHMLKMVFLPNLIPSNQIKQSINFGSCIHVFDEEVLLPRDILEKRYKIYKTFGASLSYDYFGY